MINLIYDATLLVSGEYDNRSRGGIYFVAQNVLENMLKKPDVAVTLWSSLNKSFYLEEIRKRRFPAAQSAYKPNSFVNKLSVIALNLRKKAEKNEKRYFLRKFFWAGICFVEFLGGICSFRYHLLFLADAVFFSPLTVAPWYFRIRKKVPKFVILYDVIPSVLKEYRSQVNKGWYADLMKNIDCSSFYFSISMATKTDFCKVCPKIRKENICVIPLAANESFQPILEEAERKRINDKYRIPENKKYVFSLCTLEPRKNLVRSIKAFVRFVEKNSINDLVWVMGGAEWQNFSQLIKKQLDKPELFDKYVLYAGYIADEDLPVFYSNAMWFVYTSQYEGFGLPPLEAMQCGCPVITSNNSSLPEVVGNAGIMIDWDSDEQHVKAYEKYYFDKNLREENKKKGLERSKIFSWQMTVEKMIERMNQKNKFKF